MGLTTRRFFKYQGYSFNPSISQESIKYLIFASSGILVISMTKFGLYRKFSGNSFLSMLIKISLSSPLLKGQRISMEGELVVVKPCDFLVVVEDDPAERTFLESAQSDI